MDEESFCRCCAQREKIFFCDLQNSTFKKLMSLVPRLINDKDEQLEHIGSVCIKCYQIIKNIVYQLENIVDNQKILKLSMVKKQNSEKLIKSKVVEQQRIKIVEKEPLKKLFSTSSQKTIGTNERKRSIVEEFEQKYCNLKLKKIEVNDKSPQKSSTKILNEAIKLNSQKVVVQEISPTQSKLAQKILGNEKSENSSNRSFMCISCSEKFPSFSDLECHLKKSCKEPINSEFVCFCKKVFESKDSLSKHVSSEHQQYKRHVCPLCKKVFMSVEKLREHGLTHNTKLSVSCKYCKDSFKSIELLKMHFKSCLKKNNEA